MPDPGNRLNGALKAAFAAAWPAIKVAALRQLDDLRASEKAEAVAEARKFLTNHA